MATSAYFIARFYSFKLIDPNSVADYVSNVDLITNMWCRKGRGISEIENNGYCRDTFIISLTILKTYLITQQSVTLFLEV